jgi:hypothetical protein
MVSKFVDWRNTVLNLRELRMGSTKITATPDEINQVCDGVGPTATAANLTVLTDVKDDLLAAASGGGSGVLYQVQCFDQALPMGVQVNLSLDPTDTDHVAELVNDGYSLNAGKDAFVVPETGDYLLSLWAQFAQHVTQWGLFEVQDSTGACYFQVPIPPVSLVDFGGQQPAFASSGVLRVPLVNVSGVPILVRSRLQTAAVGLLQIQVKRLDDVPA